MLVALCWRHQTKRCVGTVGVHRTKGNILDGYADELADQWLTWQPAEPLADIRSDLQSQLRRRFITRLPVGLRQRHRVLRQFFQLGQMRQFQRTEAVLPVAPAHASGLHSGSGLSHSIG